MKPLLSIIIPNYNGERYLSQCLESVCSLKPECVEVIVIDGGSTDNSLEIIQGYDSSIDFWCSEEDGGPAEAIRKGFDLACGEWLGWLNSDDFFLPRALEVLIDHIRLCGNLSKWLIGGRFYANESGQLVKHQASKPSPDLFLLRDAYGIPQESTFFRRDFYEQAGRIDVRLKCHFDLDLFLRFYQVVRPCYSDAVFGCFRQRTNQISRNQSLSKLDYSLKINKMYEKLPLAKKVFRRLLHTRFRSQLIMLCRFVVESKVFAEKTEITRITYLVNEQRWDIVCIW